MERGQRRVRPLLVLLGNLAVIALVLSPGSRSAHAAQAKAVFIANFNTPVHVAVAPGERRLLFVVEKPGRIQVLRDEVKLSPVFLDIRDLVSIEGERGLLSIAFAPDYQTSRRFYVAFTNKNGNVEIDEFQRSPTSKTRAARGTRRIVLVIAHQEASNHNGGQLQFGPDGYLYISVGDGGSILPVGDAARNLYRLLGKILRIDPRPSGGNPYGIPPDNPYVGTDKRPEIYAYGLRNPWRFSFNDTRIAIGDVGAKTQEEINFLFVQDAKGVNFGWPQYEGNVVFDNSRPGPDPPMFPMFVYPHTDNRCAVISGYIMRDPRLPALNGRLLYGDFCNGIIRSFVPNIAQNNATDDKAVGITASRLSSFGQGFDFVLYITQTTGQLSRIDPP